MKRILRTTIIAVIGILACVGNARSAWAARSISLTTAYASHYWDGSFQYTHFFGSGNIAYEAGDTINQESLQMEIGGALRDTDTSLDATGNPRNYSAAFDTLHMGGNRTMRMKVVIVDNNQMDHEVFSSSSTVNCD